MALWRLSSNRTSWFMPGIWLFLEILTLQGRETKRPTKSYLDLDQSGVCLSLRLLESIARFPGPDFWLVAGPSTAWLHLF
jgi:hypothetical protein